MFSSLEVSKIGEQMNSSIKLFADDCAIYCPITNMSDCEILQNDLNTVYHWTQLWELNLNFSKCKSLLISNKRKPLVFTYHLNNSPLHWVDTFKYLGVTTDKKLLWKDHVLDISMKASRILNLLKPSLKTQNKSAKVRAFNALVRYQLGPLT